MARIAINGLGRIGKLVARSLLDLQDDSIELVLVNEPVGRIEQHALWLEFDTVHGKRDLGWEDGRPPPLCCSIIFKSGPSHRQLRYPQHYLRSA